MDEHRSWSRVWNAPARFFHWLVALLIIGAIVSGLVAEEMPLSPAKLDLFIWHKSLGITVLWLFFLRLAWRLAGGNPGPAAGISEEHARLAEWGHAALYGMMLLLPISGWVLNSAADFPFRWFGWLAIPDLTAPNQELKEWGEAVHGVLAYVLMAMLAGHVVMAVRHHCHGSNVLLRMWPRTIAGRVLWPVLLVSLVGWTVNVGLVATPAAEKPQKPELAVKSSEVAASTEAPAPAVEASDSELPLWAMVSEQSQLNFEATYDQLPFEGRFEAFETRIQFDAESLANSRIEAWIELQSVNTDSAERDDMLPNEDWFFVANFPRAHFLATDIQPQANDGYLAQGSLTLKGITQPVAFRFTWQQTGHTAELVGTATLDRRDFEVGSGMWAEDATVGFSVTVSVNLTLESGVR